MKIAILGWGSLVSEPRGLPIAGDWQTDGPTVWIEFSRISKSGERAGCLTLVMDERHGSEATTLHVLSQRSGLPQAVAIYRRGKGPPRMTLAFARWWPGVLRPLP